MEKKFGLILPGQQKSIKPVTQVSRALSKPSIFDESSESEDDVPKGACQLKAKPAPSFTMGPGFRERRMARRVQEKALEEDPTVFQYDELYDEMETKRDKALQDKISEPKKPKYIGRLMEFAERRKLESELRIERQVQKEREAEGEQFKDKESFVTTTYRKRLEEMRKLEEQEKRDEYLEAIGDVTKQKDLDGFYRHLYEQKLGTNKTVQKEAEKDEEIAYKPIKSVKQQRVYRKRQSSMDETDIQTADAQSVNVQSAAAPSADAIKMHLQNNIDADSDFAIDSSSSSDDDDNVTNRNEPLAKQKPAIVMDSKKIALKLDAMKKETKNGNDDGELGTKVKCDTSNHGDNKQNTTVKEEVIKPSKLKRDKAEIWRKRTVGATFDAAVQRYFERKAARRA